MPDTAPLARHRILDVVAEDPQVQHVADNMEEAAMKEHGREDRHDVVGEEVVPCCQGSDELPGHETVIGVEHRTRRCVKRQMLPQENNDIYKDKAHCYNGKGAGWDIVLQRYH